MCVDLLFSNDDEWDFCPIGGEYPSANMDEDSDYHAIENGYVSITPIQLDLTDYKAIPALQEWSWEK